MKNLFVIIFILSLHTFAAMANDWGYPIMPVDEVKPGMVGTAHTVFYGDEIEEFGVEVIDVMHNFYPKLDVILVKLLGEKATKTGVANGMSGSPVYIDGKLVGALSYRFGQFTKDPIGGVTPIESMIAIEKKEAVRDVVGTRQSSNLEHYIQGVLVGTDETFWTNMLNLPDVDESTTSNLQIISSPLLFSGFQPEIISPYESYFQSMGFTPTIAGGVGAEEKAEASFKPGSAVSVSFLSGDLSIEATGTVTAVGNDKLLAFGHQLYNFGPIALPLAGTKIYTTLPSMMGSSKMATSTGVVGTFLQDRLSGVYGDLTAQPKMIPIHFEVESPYHEPTEFNFKLANDPTFNNILPLYMRMALIQAAYSARLAGEQNSAFLTGTINLTDGRSLILDDLFASQQSFGFLAAGSDAVGAADLVTSLMGTVMINDFHGPEVASIDMTLKTIPGEKYAIIESVWLDKTKVKPGEHVTLSIQVRDSEEKIQKIKKTIQIPQNVNGRRLSVIVSSGSSLSRYEVQVSRAKFIPQDFEHLLKILAERRKAQNLYIQIRAQDNGLIVDGQEMLDLPPSVMNVMSTPASGGVMKRVRDRVIFEQAIPMENVIRGANRLSLSIESPPSATSENGNGKGKKTWYR